MAENATPSKIEATRGYGAEVVLHGTIWDEANEKAHELVAERGPDLHPSVRRPRADRRPGDARARDLRGPADVHPVVVPIGGGGLISGVSTALKSLNPDDPGDRRRVVGRAGDAAQRRGGGAIDSRRSTARSTGSVKRVGEQTLEIVRRMRRRDRHAPRRADLRGAALDAGADEGRGRGRGRRAGGRAAQRAGRGPGGHQGRRVLSGGNLNLEQLRGLSWN